MKVIAIGSDHRGFHLKKELADKLCNSDFDIRDCGAYTEDSVDYPDISKKVTQYVLKNENSIGILICNSGIGMSIAANRIKNIRAALCRSVKDAELSRLHNDANILILGSADTNFVSALRIVDVFLNTVFEGGRHLSRIKKTDN